MDRDEVIKRELKLLDRTVKDYTQKIEYTLSEMRNQKVTLFLTKKNEQALLTLKVWEDKYKVTLKFILIILLPFWETFLNKRTRKTKNLGLNVRVPTLVGKKSEEILQDAIKKLYPNGENRDIWVSEEQERIFDNQLNKLAKKYDDGVRSRSDPSSMTDKSGKPYVITDFNSPQQYVKYYSRLIKKENITRDKIETEMKKRNYRNNPFKPETL